jgi:hypothetical protein
MYYNDNSDCDYGYSEYESNDSDIGNDNNDNNGNANNENNENINNNDNDNDNNEMNRALQLSLQEFEIKNNKIKQYAKQIMESDDEYYKALIIENIIETEMNIDIEDILKLVEEYTQIKLNRELLEMQYLEYQTSLMLDKEKEDFKEEELKQDFKEEDFKQDFKEEIEEEFKEEIEETMSEEIKLTVEQMREKRLKYYNI